MAMPLGKFGVQCGHAFLSCWVSAWKRDPRMALSYLLNSQPKVALVAPDAAALDRIAVKAQARGVPWEMVVDEGRTVFGGRTQTALCIGPASRTDGNSLTRGLSMVGDVLVPAVTPPERRAWHATRGIPREPEAAILASLALRGLAELSQPGPGAAYSLTAAGELAFFGDYP